MQSRYQADGSENPEFVLNKDMYRGATIIIAGDNFGCGSSREHAPWALLDYGIRCVISTSFADIFFNNCFKNGILPIVASQETVDKLMNDSMKEDTQSVEIDLENQVIVRSNGETIAFEVEPFRKHCLLNGLDDIGITLQSAAAIDAFEAKRKEQYPWL